MKKTPVIICRKISRFFTGLVVFTVIISNVTSAQSSTSKKPKIKIEVNKECDEKGNIIKYDSSYSYSWTFMGDSTDIDTIFGNHNMFFRFFSFDNDQFFTDTLKLPGHPDFPDFNQFYIFRFNDSSLTWHNNIDSIFDMDFNNFLFDHDFMPFYPVDSIFLWPDIFRYPFPHSFLDELDRYIDEMKKFFEDDKRGIHLHHGTKPQNYYKQNQKNKKGASGIVIEI